MHETPGNGQQGYEGTDFKTRPAIVFVITLLAVLAFALVMAGWFYWSLETRFGAADRLPSPLAADQIPPEPRLQVYPRQELDAARERERQRLQQYRWIDRSQGIVQIPIDRAVELLLERGLQPTGGSASNPPAGSR